MGMAWALLWRLANNGWLAATLADMTATVAKDVVSTSSSSSSFVSSADRPRAAAAFRPCGNAFGLKQTTFHAKIVGLHYFKNSTVDWGS